MKKIISCIFLSLSCSLGFGAATCSQATQAQIQKDYQQLISQYRGLDSSFVDVLEFNRPRWQAGTKRQVVFVVHGFMGTPDEMKWLASGLQGSKYHVYSGLIPGYGGTAKIANHFSFRDYQAWYRDQISLLEKCYDKIHLVGFSTGALLAFDYASLQSKDRKIASVTLISPFFSGHSLWGLWLQKLASMVLTQFPVRELYEISRFPDIRVMTLAPLSYLSEVPLQAASQVLIGGEQNLKRPVNSRLRPPVLLFLTDQDQVVNQAESEDLVRKTFLSVTARIYKNRQGPHHLMSPLVSPLASEVNQDIQRFVGLH